jgi:hypothetical protein
VLAHQLVQALLHRVDVRRRRDRQTAHDEAGHRGDRGSGQDTTPDGASGGFDELGHGNHSLTGGFTLTLTSIAPGPAGIDPAA